MPPGTDVGGYRIVSALGRGGMGAVYRAVDGAGAEVALKLLHPHLAADPSARERLRREVAHLQRVRHRGVARVLDAEIESHEAFVVTELVDGEDLAARVRLGGPLPAGDLVELGEDLRAALEVVHGAGVLHRDLTPGNILVTAHGPVLIDFGIAQAVEDARVTSTGLVTGTPGYLPPELLAGAEPSPAGDWWGWAAVLAFAATGRPPFGERPMAAVLARVQAGDVDLARLDRRTASALRAALAVEPSRRARPQDVLSELRRAADGDRDPAGPAAADRGTTSTQVIGSDGRTRVLPVPGAATHQGDPRVADGGGGDGRADETAVIGATPYPGTGYRGGDDHGDGYGDDDRYDDRYDDGYGDGYGEPYDDDDTQTYPAQDAGDDDLPPHAAPGTDEDEITLEGLRAPHRRSGSVLALAGVLLALGAVRPGVALVTAAVLAVLARSVGLDVRSVQVRRARRGSGRWDLTRAAVAWPWYLVRAVLGVLPAVLVAASVVVLVGGVGWWLVQSGRLTVAEPPPGEPAGELAGNAPWVVPALLALVTLAGLVALWFGPMSRGTRVGARWALAALAPGRLGAVTLTLLALAATVVLVLTTLDGSVPTVWWPLPGPPDLG